ncbi:helix-turn-helix domain-containing protein [Hominibacterium faecale]|uniref:helix-turn-helix domain-containing protein n=1 Tax=Hominibacterium faecale TaxID=2839743 RepID=UPI0022B2A9D7|nr:helix-turn-helix transcriptional regulator [Hominibacterium faecale]
MYLGELIRQYREKENVSLREFAEKTGLSVSYISQLERNQNPKTGRVIVPSAETFLKVSYALGISINDLIDTVDENQPISLAQIKEDWESEILDNARSDLIDYFDGDVSKILQFQEAEKNDALNDPERQAQLSRSYSEDMRLTKIIQDYQCLNEKGKVKAYEYVSDLAEQPKYKTYSEPLLDAAHERTDIEDTDDMKKYDDDIMDDENF